MKLLIRVDANNEIGFGHFFRCLSVALMLQADWKISFAISNAPSFIQEALKAHKFELENIPFFNYKVPDEKIDDIPIDLTANLLEQFQVILVDGYFFGSSYFEHLARYDIKVVTINDNPFLPLKAHALINSAPQVIEEDYQAFSVDTLAIGLEYVFLRPAFFKALKLPVIDRVTKKLLVSFGGTDHFKVAQRIVQECLRMPYIEEIHVIGRIENDFDASKRVTKFSDKLFEHSNLTANQVVNVMRECDLAILPASGVLFEAISCGLPFLISWYANNQKPFHDYLEKKLNFPSLGFVKHETSVDLGELISAHQINKLDNQAVLNKMRIKMKKAPQKMLQLFNQQIS